VAWIGRIVRYSWFPQPHMKELDLPIVSVEHVPRIRGSGLGLNCAEDVQDVLARLCTLGGCGRLT
jgi:hypothetical protein